MPAVSSSPRVKLRTTSRRVPRARAASAAAAVDDSPEPTMRLSRAILVMLLLHVVAVGGFFASSVLKEHDLKRNSSDSSASLEAEDSQVPSKGEGGAAKRAPTTSNARPSVHVVRPGETLTLIANENGVTLEALVAANGTDTVTNGLRTGQELKLPDRSPDPTTAQQNDSTSSALNMIEGHPKSGQITAATPVTSSTKNMRPVSDSGKVYVVGKGESAYNIAQKNKVTADALLRLNGIDDPKKIRPGQKLRLPAPPPVVKGKGKQS